jgi:hypothetical protein
MSKATHSRVMNRISAIDISAARGEITCRIDAIKDRFEQGVRALLGVATQWGK